MADTASAARAALLANVLPVASQDSDIGSSRVSEADALDTFIADAGVGNNAFFTKRIYF